MPQDSLCSRYPLEPRQNSTLQNIPKIILTSCFRGMLEPDQGLHRDRGFLEWPKQCCWESNQRFRPVGRTADPCHWWKSLVDWAGFYYQEYYCWFLLALRSCLLYVAAQERQRALLHEKRAPSRPYLRPLYFNVQHYPAFLRRLQQL